MIGGSRVGRHSVRTRSLGSLPHPAGAPGAAPSATCDGVAAHVGPPPEDGTADAGGRAAPPRSLAEDVPVPARADTRERREAGRRRRRRPDDDGAGRRWWWGVGAVTVVGFGIRLATVLGRPHRAPGGDAFYFHSRMQLSWPLEMANRPSREKATCQT